MIEEEDWSRDRSNNRTRCFDVSNRSRSESDRTSSDNTFWTDDMVGPCDDYLLLPEIDGSTTTTTTEEDCMFLSFTIQIIRTLSIYTNIF